MHLQFDKKKPVNVAKIVQILQQLAATDFSTILVVKNANAYMSTNSLIASYGEYIQILMIWTIAHKSSKNFFDATFDKVNS